MPNSGVQTYTIEYPAIKTSGVYYFNTDTGLRYEVRFGRKQNNILHCTIVFGITNDEFEGEEYVTTNRGEVFRVMNTIVNIIDHFIQEHPKVAMYEFYAMEDEHDHEKNNAVNRRMQLYKRYLPRLLDPSWEVGFVDNKAVIYLK